MATPEQDQLLSELWTMGMKVPDLVRKVRRRVPLRAVQAWARARRLADAGATSDTGVNLGTATKPTGKRRKLPAWMQAASDSGRTREQVRAVANLGFLRVINGLLSYPASICERHVLCSNLVFVGLPNR